MEKFELEIADQNVVVAAFRKPGGTTELFERIAQEARSHVPDVTTKKGRDQIGSLAMKVSKSKTFIEKCGKELQFTPDVCPTTGLARKDRAW